MKKLVLDSDDLLVDLVESDVINGLIRVEVNQEVRVGLRMNDGQLEIYTSYSANNKDSTKVFVNKNYVTVCREK